MKKQILALSLLLAVSLACNTTPVLNRETTPIDTGINADEWALVPAGKFYYGLHSKDSVIDYDYEMMVTHVTNHQYVTFLKEALSEGKLEIKSDSVYGFFPGEPFHGFRHEDEINAGLYLCMPLNVPGNHISYHNNEFTIDPGFENHPVVMVSWFGAWWYAKFYGYRLPNEAEWTKAARGTDERAYPWGDEIDDKVVNYTHSTKSLRPVLGTEVVRTTPVGLYNGKKYKELQTRDNSSPYGIYDMAGNAWQWVADDYPRLHYKYMRGGSFSNYAHFVTNWARNSAHPEYCSFNLGFRCIRDVKAPTNNLVESDDSLTGEDLNR
ncbi:MAG: formylglycine-generating enzyme family protein [Dysgonamonadaceae bacterium]|nr:formylglycine-generating enzyme family protein [Dysgonamonadaceae bacterium]MDD3727290.1 formylglycine-generating enzyme family protein [Dysgonamonadaceae bacterium]